MKREHLKLKTFSINGPEIAGIIVAKNYADARKIAVKKIGELEYEKIRLLKGVSPKNKADRKYFGIKNKKSINISYG